MTSKLIYLTYQTFPANTANSLQTITMLKYFSRSSYDVELIFPNRADNSSGDIEILQKHYDFKESYDELVHKVTWPSWSSLQSTTVVVIIATVIITIIIFAMDFISRQATQYIYELM